LFEPHTEFIKKGKLFPPVELGHKLLLTTDQHELILDYRVMDQQPNDADESIGVADRPKRGRRNQVEQEREHQRRFRSLRHRHHAVESDINSLEHHGLNRCPDKGLHGYKRYVGLGVLAYNLHKIGKALLDKKRAKAQIQSFST